MTLTMSRPTYGVQVGNETYSVVVTEEDWEKRKLERDRQKRLSQETNRRRKALEERKKIAEEREARKRALQLSKRRQRQTEATEKYQRAHLPPKPTNSKPRSLSGHKKAPPLDDVLQQLRSGSSEISYLSGNEEQNFTSTQQMNFSRAKFESKLKEEQQRILEEHRQNTEKEFHNEIESVSSSPQTNNISLNTSNISMRGRLDEQMERRHSYGQIFSNLDLMSGHTTGAYRALSDYSSTYLSDSVAKLFVKNEDSDMPPSQSSSHIDLNQLQLEDADDVIPSPPVQPQVYSAANQDDVTVGKPASNKLEENNVRDVTHLDDQDSLHGSSSSGTSPVSGMTSFHRKYSDEALLAEKPKSDVTTTLVNSLSNRISITPQATSIQSVESAPIPAFFSTPPSYSSERQSSSKLSSSTTNSAWAQHPVTSTSQTSKESPPYSSYVHVPSSYYVKSFRPSSAVESTNLQNTDKTVKTRPKSAVLQRSISSEYSSPHVTVTTQAKEEIVSNKSAESVPNSRKLVSSFSKPSATPISALYNDAWKKTTPAYPGTTSESKITSTTTVSSQTSAHLGVATSRSDTTLQSSTPKNDAKPHEEKPKKHSSEFYQPSEASKCKSILRKVSKYDAPHYHTAAVAARQKWVEHMTATAHKPLPITQSAKLHDTEVRDSLEVNRNGRPKSVRWHEIHYDDGTSATLADAGTVTMRKMPPAPPSVNVTNRSFRNVTDKSLRSRPTSGKAKGKAPSPEGEKPRKSPKVGKNRKLKVSTKLQVAMSPHPPAPPQPRNTPPKTQTTPSKSVPSGSMQSRLTDKMNDSSPPPHRIAWDADSRNNVTMENLKSSGSPPPVTSLTGEGLSSGNHVYTKQISSGSSSPNRFEPDHDGSFNLNKTPTDQEINWLWDKVRSCISQRPNSRGIPISKTLSDTGSDRSLYHPSSYRPLSSTQPQQKASVVSIDGTMFSNNLVHNKTRRIVRPSSAAVATAKQRLSTYNASIRRQALLQQRRNKQLASNRMKQELMATPRRYPSPRVSYFDPLPSPSSRAVSQVDESTTAFLLAETLAEQNMSEEQIMKAMDSLQRKTREAQSQINPSTLSIEEHRLLKSLERLNMRLHEVETAMASNPNLNFLNHTQSTKLRDQ